MATVIVGGGIIGCSTAFYLSELVSDPSSIHIVESSPTLFAGASGWAGGFLAKDWFAPSVSSLGSLSFALHKELSDKYNGVRNWGYLPSTALSLGIDEDVGVGGRQRGEDWLLQGASRANAAERTDFLNPDGSPAWLTQQKGGTLEVISGKNDCAQVDPAQLCRFLLAESQRRGVQLHQPATATSIASNLTTQQIESITITPAQINEPSSSSPITLPVKHLILTAGPWTPKVFSTLFPSSRYRLPISSLAGHSLLLRSPLHQPPFDAPSQPSTNSTYIPTSHAIFCAPSPSSSILFAPELFTRATGEIYIAGVNSTSKPLPELATEKDIDEESVETLKQAAQTLMAAGSQFQSSSLSTTSSPPPPSSTDLEIVKVGLCWRPVTSNGTPIISRIPDGKLGGIKTGGSSEGGCVFVAAGHGPWGISLSLGTGKVMAEMVLEKSEDERSADVGGLGVV
ncbi:putative fad dependent oxidoreductase superfamily [Phaeomoniella chlamydospora]|uniref:Putative fad dependent oxidoreductase superfamily n=1 Tax=Phaeomoniella chlamydospora TaxID=158046 RepID=A0A0G2E343_PHACM|nr:putative fad dependent oxidoreductase superfamily [Phaeomoniella chlamydospora]